MLYIITVTQITVNVLVIPYFIEILSGFRNMCMYIIFCNLLSYKHRGIELMHTVAVYIIRKIYASVGRQAVNDNIK